MTSLICSDLISRGIDISHVSHVVSYDTPVDMRKYVHRVGRTARAGRDGDAWTLVEEQEVGDHARYPEGRKTEPLQARYFKAMLKEHGHLQKVKRMKVPQSEIQPLLGNYQVGSGLRMSRVGRLMVVLPGSTVQVERRVFPVVVSHMVYSALVALQLDYAHRQHSSLL